MAESKADRMHRERYERAVQYFQDQAEHWSGGDGLWPVRQDAKAGDRIVLFAGAWNPEAIVLVVEEVVPGTEYTSIPTEVDRETWDGIEGGSFIGARFHLEFNGWDNGQPRPEPVDWMDALFGQ